MRFSVNFTTRYRSKEGEREKEKERHREAYISFFAYANRHIIIDKEEKRVAYDAN